MKKGYFDWAATAIPDEEVQRQALDYALSHWANPSAIHRAGKDARLALEEARDRCAKALGVKVSQVFFTSGGTESDHIPLLSLLARPQKGSIVLSSIEHPALREMAKAIKNCGWKIICVNPDKNGFVKADSIIEALEDDTAFVSVMAVNNETGAIQEVYEIADKLCNWGKGRRKPFFHVDCVQAAGKIKLNLNYKGIDSAAISAHKIGGPRGIGLLYLAKEITPFLRGGGQEKNIRSGTENLFGAYAAALCLEKNFIKEGSNQSLFERLDRQKRYTRDFSEKILKLSNKAVKKTILIPPNRIENEEKFSPWVLQAAFIGIPGQVMERALSAKGFYISTGSACSAGSHERPILDSMGLSAEEKESAVRFSFGPETTEEDMDALYQALCQVLADFEG